jgi:excinuclease ABC subunit B
MTGSMRRAIDETNRRRRLQLNYNVKHDITPRGIVKTLDEVKLSTSVADAKNLEGADVIFEAGVTAEEMAKALEADMLREAQALNFEKAASLRDRLEEVRLQLVLEAEDRSKRRKGSRGTRSGRR